MTLFTTTKIIITKPVTLVFVSLFLSHFFRLHVFPPPLLPLSLLFLSLTTYPITGPKYICRRYLNLVTFPTLITLILLPNLHIIVSRNFACKRTHAPTCICNRASESNWCLWCTYLPTNPRCTSFINLVCNFGRCECILATPGINSWDHFIPAG